jgi:hypothetical protein
MPAVRDAWTDERLDDLNANVDRRFDDIDRRFDRVDRDLRELRRDTKAGFDTVHLRFDAMQRTIILGFAGIAASLVGAVIVNHL